MSMTRRTALRVMAGAIPALGAVVTGCARSSMRRPVAADKPAPKSRPGRFSPRGNRCRANTSAPTGSATPSSASGRTGRRSACPSRATGMPANMYIQGTTVSTTTTSRHYGHPSKFGFMEIDNLWKAEHWEPEKLMALYKRAGAKYFVALANHHDNFDAYDSKYHAWNSVNVGPKKDIVGIWAKVARENGLRFGVSNHSAHAWHWFQTAYGYDGEGPLAGRALRRRSRSPRPTARANGGKASIRRSSIPGRTS